MAEPKNKGGNKGNNNKNKKPKDEGNKVSKAPKITTRAVEQAEDAANAADGMTEENPKWWMPLVIVIGVVAGATVLLLILRSYFGNGDQYQG